MKKTTTALEANVDELVPVLAYCGAALDQLHEALVNTPGNNEAIHRIREAIYSVEDACRSLVQALDGHELADIKEVAPDRVEWARVYLRFARAPRSEPDVVALTTALTRGLAR